MPLDPLILVCLFLGVACAAALLAWQTARRDAATAADRLRDSERLRFDAMRQNGELRLQVQTLMARDTPPPARQPASSVAPSGWGELDSEAPPAWEDTRPVTVLAEPLAFMATQPTGLRLGR